MASQDDIVASVEKVSTPWDTRGVVSAQRRWAGLDSVHLGEQCPRGGSRVGVRQGSLSTEWGIVSTGHGIASTPQGAASLVAPGPCSVFEEGGEERSEEVLTAVHPPTFHSNCVQGESLRPLRLINTESAHCSHLSPDSSLSTEQRVARTVRLLCLVARGSVLPREHAAWICAGLGLQGHKPKFLTA